MASTLALVFILLNFYGLTFGGTRIVCNPDCPRDVDDGSHSDGSPTFGCKAKGEEYYLEVICFGLNNAGQPNLTELLRRTKFNGSTINIFGRRHAKVVIDVRLNGKNYSIPADLFQHFTNLTRLSIGGGGGSNTVTIPSNAFQGLNELESVTLSEGKFQTNMNELFRPLASRLEGVGILNMNFKSKINAFKEFTKLKYFTISDSDLDEFPTEILRKSAGTIITIQLLNNKITRLTSDNLKIFTKLRRLKLDDNEITSIDANAFENLRDLRELSLSRNRIANLNANMFRSNTDLEKMWLIGCRTSGLTRQQFSFLDPRFQLYLQSSQPSESGEDPAPGQPSQSREEDPTP